MKYAVGRKSQKLIKNPSTKKMSAKIDCMTTFLLNVLVIDNSYIKILYKFLLSFNVKELFSIDLLWQHQYRERESSK